jgi:hypothetical protein
MALSHITKVFAVQQARIAKLLTDPSSAPTTYGTTAPVTGTKSLKVTGTVTTVDLRGDNTVLDSDSLLTGVEVEIDYAKLSMDNLATWLGGTVTDSGTTPNQVSSWILPSPATFNYFKLEGRSMTADPVAGDFHVLFPKLKLADFPQLGLAEETYQLFNVKCHAMPPYGTPNGWMTITLNETAVPIT